NLLKHAGDLPVILTYTSETDVPNRLAAGRGMMGNTPSTKSPAQSDAAEIKVAIIEDQTHIREGLALLIDSADGYRCTGEFESMEEALDKIGKQLPDVALVDIGLPGMSGIEGIHLLKQRYPDVLLVALTVYADDDRIFEALCAGATGYLLKKTRPERLLDSLKDVMSGGAPRSEERRVGKECRCGRGRGE